MVGKESPGVLGTENFHLFLLMDGISLQSCFCSSIKWAEVGQVQNFKVVEKESQIRAQQMYRRCTQTQRTKEFDKAA